MNPAALNLLYFAGIVILIVLGIRISKNKNLWIGKQKKQKRLIEDILKQLFHVAQSKRTATISDLSGALEVKRRVIFNIVLEMTQNELLTNKNEVLKLTKKGSNYALKVIRVHRLWEKYLAEKTGYQAADWHHLAENMEHQLSEVETKKLSIQLGHPMFDPHGDPIPTQEGAIFPQDWTPLPAYPINTIGKIAHIEDEPDVIYQHLLKSKVFVGSQIEIIKSSDKEVIFKSEGNQHQFAPIIAANISVMPIPKEEVLDKNVERLSLLKKGELAHIVGISKECRGANRRRLLDLGVLPGTQISVELESPMKDPIAYNIRNTSIALRNSLADLILISKSVNV